MGGETDFCLSARLGPPNPAPKMAGKLLSPNLLPGSKVGGGKPPCAVSWLLNETERIYSHPSALSAEHH